MSYPYQFEVQEGNHGVGGDLLEIDLTVSGNGYGFNIKLDEKATMNLIDELQTMGIVKFKRFRKIAQEKGHNVSDPTIHKV